MGRGHQKYHQNQSVNKGHILPFEFHTGVEPEIEVITQATTKGIGNYRYTQVRRLILNQTQCNVYPYQ